MNVACEQCDKSRRHSGLSFSWLDQVVLCCFRKSKDFLLQLYVLKLVSFLLLNG